jgi:hypothetical protein
VLDDEAMERVLMCLRVIGKYTGAADEEKKGTATVRTQRKKQTEDGVNKEEKSGQGMVVISQLEFRKYLDKTTDPISAAAYDNLSHLKALGPDYHDGEVDVLAVHSKHALLVMEVKAVWGKKEWLATASEAEWHKALVDKVLKDLKQLDKNVTRLQHLTSDIQPPSPSPPP